MLVRCGKERDERDVVVAEVHSANEERLRWLSTYQSLAQMRMLTQQEQLAPLMIAAKQSQAELVEAEELQVCIQGAFPRPLETSVFVGGAAAC
jgi:hypothetical protein